MRKFKKIYAILLATMMCVSMLTACTKANCKATSAISFKTPEGHYRLKNKLGSLVVMNLSFKVTSEETTATPVKAVLTIPHAKNVEAEYSSGEVIPSKYNSWRNETTYELTADASKDAEMMECVIKFIPCAAGSAEVTLVYDGHVDSSYDVKRPIEFDDDPVDDFTDEYYIDEFGYWICAC